jgi:hypothetical protein
MERAIEAEADVAVDWSVAAEQLMSGTSPVIQARELNLVVDVGQGLQLHQDVVVTFDEPRLADGELWVPVRWTPAGHSRFLPSFVGVLELLRTDDDADRAAVRLFGSYTIPLGVVGRFGDGLWGRQLAQETMRVLVEDLARGFDQFARHDRVTLPAPTYPEVLRDRPS